MIEIIINKKPYKIGCTESDKEWILRCADELNNLIDDFKVNSAELFSSLNQERIFLFILLDLLSQGKEAKSVINSLSTNSVIETKIQKIANSLQKLENILKK